MIKRIFNNYYFLSSCYSILVLLPILLLWLMGVMQLYQKDIGILSSIIGIYFFFSPFYIALIVPGGMLGMSLVLAYERKQYFFFYNVLLAIGSSYIANILYASIWGGETKMDWITKGSFDIASRTSYIVAIVGGIVTQILLLYYKHKEKRTPSTL